MNSLISRDVHSLRGYFGGRSVDVCRKVLCSKVVLLPCRVLAALWGAWRVRGGYTDRAQWMLEITPDAKRTWTPPAVWAGGAPPPACTHVACPVAHWRPHRSMRSTLRRRRRAAQAGGRRRLAPAPPRPSVPRTALGWGTPSSLPAGPARWLADSLHFGPTMHRPWNWMWAGKRLLG